MRFLSLFSGVEAASQAWEFLGWECAGFSEIEGHPCAVLAHRYPHVPNLGDVTKIGLCARYDPIWILKIAAKYPASRLAAYYTNLAQLMENLGPINLVVFGSPCQDLSVAGKRRGFTDHAGELTRSGLFHVAIDIIRWARRRWGARFALWENVPGAFTNNAGRDFAAVVDQMAGLEGTIVPPKGWGTEGCTVGAEAMVEWATLDAQWFGVAQRRRRVFALADFGDLASRPPILLEPEGLRGDSAPRREAWEEVTGTLSARTQGGGGLGTDFECQGVLVPVGPDGGILQLAFGGNNRSGPIDVATARSSSSSSSSSGRLDFDSETFLVQGIDLRNLAMTGDVGHTVQAGQHAPDPGGTPHVLVRNSIAYGFQPRIGRNGRGDMGDVVNALNAQSGETGKGDAAPCVAYRTAGDSAVFEEGDRTAPLTTGTDRSANIIVWQWRVRRMTERECERLQGMADDWTLVPFRGKMAAAGPRYKSIGNSMAVTVMRHIGRKIDKALMHEFFA